MDRMQIQREDMKWIHLLQDLVWWWAPVVTKSSVSRQGGEEPAIYKADGVWKYVCFYSGIG